MFDRYIIVDNSLRLVPGGYELQARIPYYRGLGLSMVEPELVVDGVVVSTADVTFTVHGNSYRSDLLPEVLDDRWPFTEAATLTVDTPGGLSAGEHEIELRVRLRVSYQGPDGSLTTGRKTLTAV